MAFPERFSNLPDYAFPRLRALLDPHAPGGDPIAMTIGEPTHPQPAFVAEVLAANLDGFGVYPPNDGTPELLAANAAWLKRRYGIGLGPERIMGLNGTREGLFNAALALCPETKNGQRPAVLMPNPFYQVYAVAALAAGAEPVYVPATAATGFLPDYAGLDPDLLDRVAIAYLCSPANPQGAVASRDYWAGLLALAEKHDFIVLADECYSEVWHTAPPPGVLEVAAATGAGSVRAEALPQPAGVVILTITGAIAETNADGAAEFDLDMLRALGLVEFDTTTLWTDGVQHFTGVPLVRVLNRIGATGTAIRAEALNDYVISIPVEDAVEGGPILAFEQNGTRLSVRDKGPLWVVYPYDSDPAYKSEVIYSRSVWQLQRMVVQP